MGKHHFSAFFASLLFFAAADSYAKTPAWLPDEHPRLLSTAGEKSALVTKLTAPNTLSSTVWTQVLANYRKAGTTYDYADGAVVYWITGNTAAADAAISNANDFMSTYPMPTGLIPPPGYNLSDYPVEWWRYHNLLLTYDFAYARLNTTQKTQFRDYIAREGALCTARGPSYGPGNIDMAFALCALGSGIVLEGQDASKDIQNEAVIRGTTANSADNLYWPIDVSNLVVSSQPNGGGTLYRFGIDYNWSWCSNGYCVDWSPTSAGAVEPAAGATYYASYHWTADTEHWKTEGRRAFENHVNYHWRDGAYNGGLNPYGDLAASYIPYFVEMLKRDTGLDFSKNNDLKKIVDPYIYELLPGNPKRWNCINDATGLQHPSNAPTYPMSSAYRPWMRPFIDWATSALTWDAEGYAQRSYWFWTQYYRGSDGKVWYQPDADWREAFWFNDSLIGTYPNPAIPAANWPKNRYFRGKEIVYTRSDAWGGTNTNALVASFLAGPHNYQNEHDQGDAGTFTFFQGGEDWAIDTGYGGSSLLDHNGLGIDGHGYDASGVYGDPNNYTEPQKGGFAHFDSVVLTDGASALKAELTHAWSLTDTPYLDHDQRYFAVVTGSKTPYLIVADDIQKDTSNHSFEWYLHTRENNSITTAASGATINGHTGARLLIQTLNPAGVSASTTNISDGDTLNHPRLTITASGVQNPNFLNLLIPTASGATAPTVTKTVLANGIKGLVTWPDGTLDTILWRTGAGIISDGIISSDAKLLVHRKAAGVTSGLLFIDGRIASENGNWIAKVVDGTKPASFVAFGANIGVSSPDATMIRSKIPGVSSATLEDGAVNIPVNLNSGTLSINAPLSLQEMRRGAGVRYFEDFNDNYPDYFYRIDKELNASQKFLVKNGAFELDQASTPEWMTLTRRDSTVWRREDIFPTIIPPLDHSDAKVSFRYKFASLSDQNRKLRFYLRTKYRDRTDWQVNQDYVRVEINAAENGSQQNLVSVGQRVNGTSGYGDTNDILTGTISSVSRAVNDTNWHSISVILKANNIKLNFDGSQLIDGNLPVTIPTAPASGFLEWRLIGADPALIDDLKVEALDSWAPAAPSSGTISVTQSGTGNLSLQYADGMSPDAALITLYESSSPIIPTTPISGLTSLGTSSVLTGMSFSGANTNRYHAVSVKDQSGNESLLFPLGVDSSVPAAPGNLTVH